MKRANSEQLAIRCRVRTRSRNAESVRHDLVLIEQRLLAPGFLERSLRVQMWLVNCTERILFATAKLTTCSKVW